MATPGWMYSVRDDSHNDILANANAAAADAMQRILGVCAAVLHFFVTMSVTVAS